jgi:hypothetical protein
MTQRPKEIISVRPPVCPLSTSNLGPIKNQTEPTFASHEGETDAEILLGYTN